MPAGGQWCPAPHLKSVPPVSCLDSRLLHTSNIVFKNCGPLFGFWPHLLRNPGHGPGRRINMSCRFGSPLLPVINTPTQSYMSYRFQQSKQRHAHISIEQFEAFSVRRLPPRQRQANSLAFLCRKSTVAHGHSSHALPAKK